MGDMEVGTSGTSEAASECAAPAPTTTISTISLKSGDTRLVIALLQSREYLQLKVLEVKPDLTQLGATLRQAEELQQAHDDVLQQLQSKQSPVEGLLRQADQLIATQKPRAEVYAAMAESLGLAWQDVNAHLEQRKHLLDLNVAYQSRAEECYARMRAVQSACQPTVLPHEIDTVKHLLTQLHDLRRAMLESLMLALQHGKALLETVKHIASQGTLDSRPDRIKTHAQCAVTQVELWLESLHDRRRDLDVTWTTTRQQLEQCLALALLASDLYELEEYLHLRQETLLNSFDQLGNSSSSGELLLHEHLKLVSEAKDMQDRGLKITKATEQIVNGKASETGEAATAKAYDVLHGCAEYVDAIEQRENMLKRAIAFFYLAHNALTKLDQLEIQLMGGEQSSPQFHAMAARALDDITEEPVQEGYAILETVGRSAQGAEGVRRTVEELENRKINLEGLCTAHKEENLRVTQALTSFLENQNELFSWLVSVAESFLQDHQDMGSVLNTAQDFLDLHLQLLKELQQKGAEINQLLLTLPPILERLNDDQRRDVDDKVDNLHSHWLNMKSVIEARIDLATEYVKFHRWAVKLADAYDELAECCKAVDGVDQETITRVEQKWLHIQQLFAQLSNLGQNFIQETVQVVDPSLDVDRARLCVETLLEHFAGRRLTSETCYNSWETTVVHERQYQLLWERNVTESRRTIDWVSKLDAQLYPILTGEPTASSKSVARELEDKLHVALPEVKRALTEIELRVKAADTLALRSDAAHAQNEVIGNKLNELHEKLQVIFTDYQVLLQMLISFFKNLADLEKTIDNLQLQYRLTNLPHSVADVEQVLKEHDASRQAILELFKFTNNECQQIVSRIREQEPQDCAQHDIDRLTKTLEIKRMAWESAWMDRKTQLEQHRQLCHFDGDLFQINTTLNDLGKQLNDLRGQYGESLAAAKATSAAFVYFEKTIELLEARIHTFVSTAEAMVTSEHASAPHVEHELRQLQARWAAFRRQVAESRRLINLSAQYFTLVEEADEWFRAGSKLLVTIARKSTAVKRPEEATQLLNDVEVFLKPGEALQDERIKKISRLAVELYGEDRASHVTTVLQENREMMESFTMISEELTTLSRTLILAEQQRQTQKKEQEDMDASLAEARAEAAAAKAAAQVADEARRAAEAAAKALRDAVPPVHKTVDVGVEAMPPVEPEPKQKSPPESLPPPVVEETPKPVPPMFIIPLHDSNIQEGERFTFECSVTGMPRPDVIWYKEGMSIQNNPDYVTSHSECRCTLTIEETFAEDSGRFTCTAGNVAGIAETSATLSVNEAEPDEVLTPPVFTRHLHPATAKEGSCYQLECSVDGNPLPTVQWYKAGACVDTSPDYVITYNNGDAVLRFEEVFLEDQAEYSCKAVNQQGSATSTANLNVEPLEPTEAPHFTAPLSNVMARAGQKVKLECDVTGLPPPALIWSHNGKPIREARDVKVTHEDTKAQLVISEAFPNDAGAYTVTATNLAGEASSTCNVSVKGRLPTETSDSELASDMEPVKPAIQLQLKNLSVFEGTRVQLDCIIIGQPEPEVIWYHDGRPVKESPEFKLLFQGDRCSLVIQEVFLEDAGEYRVTAINSGGEASSCCSLTVTSVSATNESVSRHMHTTEEVQHVQPGSAPKFSQLLTDILASEGDKVSFECCVSGDPRPDIRWYLNNAEIQPKEHMEFGEDAEGTVSLTILEVSPDNKGVYTVKASNSHGEAKCFATLIVKVTTSPESLVRQVEDYTAAPSFRELFADRNVYENEATKFECIVAGKPTPKVRWCFNDQPVAGTGFLVSTSGERQVLSIPQVTPDLVGKVSCVAENEAGKASCVAVLKIMRDADPSDTSSLVPVETASVTEQIGSSSFSMKRSVFVQSSSSHVTSSSTTLGSGSEPVTQVHSLTTHAHESMKQEGDKPPVQMHSQKVHEFRRTNQEEPIVREESFVKVTNGESSVEMVTAPVKSLRKMVAPRFMTPLNGKIVDQGTDIVFEGIIDGFPQPTVTWSKNGVDLTPGGQLSISWECNKARMELKGACVKDAGRYTCKAVNEVGSASSTADLVVKKTVFPPVFGRRLQAQMIKVGERVNVEVEVTGMPDPTVTWYKDGQQILGAIPGSKFRTKMQGDCYTLIIEKASLDYSGKYMVRAVNAGGEAQSIADFLVYEPQPASTVDVVKHLVFEDIVHHTTQHHKEQPQVPTAPVIVPNTISFGPLPPSSTSESVHITESSTSEKHVTIKMAHNSYPGVPDKVATVPEVTPPVKTVEIPVEIEKKEPEKVAPVPENEGVESQSITKQSAFDFFVNKMHENDEKVEKKPERTVEMLPKAPTEVPAESFVHRREQSMFGNLDFHSSRPQYGSPVYALQPAQIGPISFPDEEPNPLIESLTQSIQSTGSSMEEFFLQPEPPPEMGYSPKPEGPTTFREDVTSRVKRLEETSRVLSPIEIPSGAVRIFPIKLEPLKQEPKPVELPQKPVEPVQLQWPPVYEKEEVKEEMFVKEEVSLSKSYVTGGEKTVPVSIAKPWEPTPPASLTPLVPEEAPLPWLTPVERMCESLPIMRPQADILQRPSSPRPSAEAVSMEKLWSSRRDPEPKAPTTLRPVSPKPVTSFNSETWSSSHSKTEKSETFSTGYTEDIKRAASPRPSAEGVQMEKLWTPHKPATPEPIFRPSTVERHGEKDRPSQEGLKMDKIWAHKHKDSGLKKSWPPTEGEDEKPIIPWSAKTPEKVWPPVETKVSLTQKEVINQVEILQQFTQEPALVQEPPPRFVQEPPAVPEPPPKIEPELPKPPEPFHHVTFKPTEAFKEFRKMTDESSITNQMSSYVPPPLPQPTQHYVSESRVSYSSSMPQNEIVSTTSSSSTEVKQSSFSHFESSETHSGSTVVADEERNWKPSEAKKNWPPNQKDEFVLNAPPPVRDVLKTRESPSRPQSFHELHMDDIILEPGAPPEFGIARAPLERRLSYKETIEQELEKDLNKEPSRVPFGSVRLLPMAKERSQPPPLPPKEAPQMPPPIPAKTPQVEVKSIPKKEIKPIETKFERFPDLEPFPYQASPSKPKSTNVPPPPKPSKFRKGEFGTSDYDSDMESTIIHPKWRPYESDTEDNVGYRKVRAPSFTPQPRRPQSTEPEPLPPSRFDNPPKFQGPPRPLIDKVQVKKDTKTEVKVSTKVESKVEKVKKHHHHHHHQEEKRKISPPNIKPGTPPEFVQAPPKVEPKKVVEAPVKVVAKTQESGYMADTDEPRLLMKQSKTSTTSKHEETSIQTTIQHFTKITEKHSSQQESSQSTRVSQPAPVVPQTKIAPVKPQPIYQAQHRKPNQRTVSESQQRNVTSFNQQRTVNQSTSSQQRSVNQSASKVLVPSPIPHREERPSSLEPFPFVAEPSQPVTKRPLGPPPPSPSKFLKGDFKESDYESDFYDGRIPPRWRPDASDTDGPTFKPVHPVLTPSLQSRPSLGGRTPTPPTEFDDPPQFGGPPRPKFTPIEKQPEEVAKPVSKPQAVFKPKPVTPKSIPPMEVIVATPAVKQVLGLKPGSPPQMGFAPRTQKSSPYNNATQTETSNVVNFAESTEHSHRVVSVQQTTRIIKFGDKENKPAAPQPSLEPFPYKPDNVTNQKRRSGPPPTTPKKFVPGEVRESDYESDVEGVHFKPKWTPGEDKEGDLHYRKVQPPMTRSASVPAKGTRVPTPMEYDTVEDRQEMTSRVEVERLRRVEEMRKRFGDERTTSQELILKPGSPPEMGYAAGKIPPAASYAATQHMTEMTSCFKSKAQQFVDDIIADVDQSRKPDKPILKPLDQSQPGAAEEPQAYREESRLAEYGGSPWSGLSPNKASTPVPLVVSSNQITQPRKPPTFITPLRDIAVVSGQTARFECIVQAEPPPNVLWSSNGRILENSGQYLVEFRNGVCRLTIPQATTVDGGSYTCTATNMLGTIDTSANLLVPGERRFRNI